MLFGRFFLKESSHVHELEADVNEALALMERDFPVDIQVYETAVYVI